MGAFDKMSDCVVCGNTVNRCTCEPDSYHNPYLVIEEDGTMYTSDTLSDSMFAAMEAGIITVVDMERKMYCTGVNNGGWMWEFIPNEGN